MTASPPSGTSIWKAIGPGILFAGAAVGVSHLVQSTRAGASFGLALVFFVVVANVVKYPAFRFGPQYSAATGVSLLEGYRRQGRWALALYAVLTVGTMFTVEAAVALVTAALFKVLFGLSWSPLAIAAGMIVLCAGLLAVGRYRWLDRISKVVVMVLTVSTLIATAIALPRIDFSATSLWPSGDLLASDPTILFLAALVGWMPSAIDVSVWQSLWTLARARDSGHRPSVRESLIDFHVGYIGTVVLAVCFLILGASVMYGSGAEFQPGAAGFAAQILGLYVSTLGEWSKPIIGTAACAVMFSTTLTVVDGFPRALAVLVARFRGPEDPDALEEQDRSNRIVYWLSLAVIGVGSILTLYFLLDSLKKMVDLATTLSFMTAPALALLNHRVMFSDDVPRESRPSEALRIGSMVAIAVLAAFALYYLSVRFG